MPLIVPTQIMKRLRDIDHLSFIPNILPVFWKYHSTLGMIFPPCWLLLPTSWASMLSCLWGSFQISLRLGFLDNYKKPWIPCPHSSIFKIPFLFYHTRELVTNIETQCFPESAYIKKAHPPQETYQVRPACQSHLQTLERTNRKNAVFIYLSDTFRDWKWVLIFFPGPTLLLYAPSSLETARQDIQSTTAS